MVKQRNTFWSEDSLFAEYSGNTLDRIYAVGSGVDEVLGDI